MSLVDPILYHELFTNVTDGIETVPEVSITFKNLNWKYVIVNFILPITLLIVLAFFLKFRFQEKHGIKKLSENDTESIDSDIPLIYRNY